MTDTDERNLKAMESSDGKLLNCQCSDQQSNDKRLWRRYCGLAFTLATVSVLLCAVIWLENVSIQKRIDSFETRFNQLEELIEQKVHTRIESILASDSSSKKVRTIRQVSSTECLCPPGRRLISEIFTVSIRLICNSNGNI